MAKATLTTRDGATVTIEGSQEEVASLISRLGRGAGRQVHEAGLRGRSANSKPAPMALIAELIAEGFFREPKELGAIRLALREKGHFYPVTTLSPLMLRLVRRKELRRIKDKKRWTYVG